MKTLLIFPREQAYRHHPVFSLVILLPLDGHYYMEAIDIGAKQVFITKHSGSLHRYVFDRDFGVWVYDGELADIPTTS